MDYFRLLLEVLSEIKPTLLASSYKNAMGENAYGEVIREIDSVVDERVKKILSDKGFRGLIISEEGVSGQSKEPCIYLDPVDGSLNYSRGLSQYGFLIAFSKKCSLKDVSIGLVWVAESDLAIIGYRGKGVFFISGSSIEQVVEINAREDPDVLLEVGDTVGEKLSWIKKMASIRHFGSMAYSFTLFVKGVIDGIIDVSSKLKFTDVAAFIPILDELKLPYRIHVLDNNYHHNPRVGVVIANNYELFSKLLKITI